MNKRGSDYSSKSHREIINQFMVEWDGLSSNNQGVIVMAATNRPFDLDDAVLRRMPRRILGIIFYLFIYLFTHVLIYFCIQCS
jgi:SpoVK/Ycf46/Vps4 family AAA+-type ATPase